MEKEKKGRALFIAYNCDEWRTTSSLVAIGVFNKTGLLKYLKGNFEKFEMNDEKLKKKDLIGITIEDILNQKIDYLHVIETKVNEEF